ncbi:MarR family transcriptional regulator [Roseateles sp. DAIF2]|uniref:MarR family winged helix-turn-helix transcriptional regulator n=1 Tax=Roseateles sp. DAIF2 TaxID=2714952 RepID=UPI0018A30046|nr:MarR family transcriptional regulator [Roseateles sp. DAIF2]QPF75574.1 MarR family transcriptional regulator [Roseateles sp. DAIF2]
MTTTTGRRAAATPAQVLRRFRQVFNAVRGHFAQIEKRTGLGGAQLWALSIVRERPGIGIGELARAMDVHQSTASNLVKGLVQRELLLAEKNSLDRRVVQLQLMPAALRLLKRAPGPVEGVLPQALQALDAATLRRLDQDLGRLISELGVDERGAGIPLSQL